MKSFPGFLICLTILLAVSCDSDESGAVLTDQQYFPFSAGTFLIYDVSQINYTLGVPETLAYQLKVAIIDSYLNDQGDSTYVIHRSTRNTEADDWVYLDTWSVRRDGNEVILQEGNIPYVRLLFPTRNGQVWDGNRYNTLGSDEYELGSVKTSATVNNETFQDCITVTQSDNDDHVVFLDERKEVYARDIGLIEKETTQLYYCTQPECLGQEIVQSGIIYKQTIREYGEE